MRAETHLVLVQKLLEDFGQDTNSEATLLHLHALFGPTLVSALQLVDDRDVVRVRLPGGRIVYQVSSSTGAPYTLYLTLPSLSAGKEVATAADGGATVAPGSVAMDGDADERPRPRSEKDAGSATLLHTASGLGHMFCPCPGFAYQSLLTDKAEMCKHLLAVLLAFHAGKFVESEVGMPAVVGLLNLTPVP